MFGQTLLFRSFDLDEACQISFRTLHKDRLTMITLRYFLLFTGVVFMDFDKASNSSSPHTFPESIHYKIRMDSEKVPPTDSLRSMEV